MQQLRQDFEDANQDEIATNRALLAIKKFRQSATPEPKVSDFYEPSPEAKHYQNAAVAALGLLGGLGIAGTVSLLL